MNKKNADLKIKNMQNQKALYSESDLKMMRSAEDSILTGKNRIEELRLFALNSGIKRI